jgi:hypothetical protein
MVHHTVILRGARQNTHSPLLGYTANACAHTGHLHAHAKTMTIMQRTPGCTYGQSIHIYRVVDADSGCFIVITRHDKWVPKQGPLARHGAYAHQEMEKKQCCTPAHFCENGCTSLSKKKTHTKKKKIPVLQVIFFFHF